jgi:transcriptional regulator with XRE-family HTH domain
VSVGLAVRRMRVERGITQESLAFKANVTISTLSRIERSQNGPTWGNVRRIAAALEVTVGELAAEDDMLTERGL